mmetsp:Transcript_11967/g.10349  ORF Transcript_11967/g.10349 Transcript_11967/m.10349 type:complete len:173 (+) Transcript_11967:87-605(+)|eukprot:CAMPEP_0114587140 /NCGR_PEP_ID=MMETSP0125-20121206/10173_1 /TAXON_ID=485358 ORGANISM="Aristerostoma sp., Strain ATCC 50986" /NCGR_SAMPLE_ID=MMETSP0125 /ASSEMBLY_ACC=CAM_ASM_000245 /LENGTH=172 /DNA_ID=CAMNT_0001782899 /DNA_START=65 /DNA_END=583 /DNA_ORIENTATION=-
MFILDQVEKLPGMIHEKPSNLEGWVKALNYFSGLGLCVLGIMDFILQGSFINPFSWLYPFYYILFGCMLISYQVDITFINENFKFLAHPLLRGIFTMYTGTLLLHEIGSGSDLILKIVAFTGCGVLCFVACFHFYTYYKIIKKGGLSKKDALDSDLYGSALTQRLTEKESVV